MNSKSGRYPLVLLFILIFIWGSSFILIKKGLEGFNPIQYVAIRLALSAILFTPLLIWRFRKIDWTLWPYILAVGYLGAAIPFTLYGYGQTKVSSSVAGMINAMTPVFTFIVGILFFKSGFRWLQFVGILLGLMGSGLLIFHESNTLAQVNIGSGILLVIATIFYGFNANVVNTKLKSMHPLDLSSSSFVLAGIPAIFYLLQPGQLDYIMSNPESYHSLGYLALLVIIGTVMATILFFKLIQMTNAVFGTLVAYFIPIVAILWGILDGESVSLIHLLGISAILSGVYLVRRY